MSAPEGLWSVQEVRTQSVQVAGQLDVWDCLPLEHSRVDQPA